MIRKKPEEIQFNDILPNKIKESAGDEKTRK